MAKNDLRWVRVSEWVPSVKFGVKLSDDLSIFDKMIAKVENRIQKKTETGPGRALFLRKMDAERLGLIPKREYPYEMP